MNAMIGKLDHEPLAIRDMTDYKAQMHAELEELKVRVEGTALHKGIMDTNWFESVSRIINEMGPDFSFHDQKYHLFRICRDQPELVQHLHAAIYLIESLAKDTKRLRYFRETKQKLKSPVANQIQGAIFELLVLASLRRLSNREGLSIDLYPNLPTGRRVEAKVKINSRWCHFEAKALGYSQHDVGMKMQASRVGSHSVESMVKQITDALTEKSIQLSGAPNDEPTVVFLALGYNADSHSAPWGIDEYFQSSKGENISAVVLYGSFICNKLPTPYLNGTARTPLAVSEKRILSAL